MTAVPPDTNGAVGPNHYVQWVNNAFVIFNKQGGQVQAPIDDNTFWGSSTCNQQGGFSDPTVQYDRIAGRWIVGEVAVPLFPGLIGQFAQCFAVSTTSDPAGSYYMWGYGFGTSINDYPKIAVWPDGYYVTWNIFQNGSNFIGPEACAFDRNAMLKGSAAPALVCFQLSTAFASLLPSDLDGATAPPAGSPNFFMEVDPASMALNLWKFHVDFTTPTHSTFTGPASIPGVAAFTAPCPNTQDCIPQPDPTASLDALGDRLMYRLAYRNFGDHESLVANHTVLTSPVNTTPVITGVRWYEIRNPNGTVIINQQGTFAPDTDSRWMASVAMDKSGNIAVGYSVSSTATSPSIRYTGWEVGNTPGSLQAETWLVAGGGSQTGANRWGDYSAMQIDPSDDCTFWYTQEYQATTQATGWNTRIGAFKFPSCGQALISTATSVGSSLNPSVYGNSVTFTATVTPSSGPAGSVTFRDGSTVLGTQPLSGGHASYQTSSLAAGTHSITAVYGGDSFYASSTSPALSQSVSQASTSTSISGPASSTYGQQVTLSAAVTPPTATGSVQFFDGAASLGTSPLSSGAASLSTSALGTGGHSITAKYLGAANYLSSTSGGLSLTVSKAATSTTLTSSPNPSGLSQSVTFTATVNPTTATGTVTFSVDGTTQAPVTLSSGQAKYITSSLAAGTHNVSAQYGGDSNYSGSTSSTVVQTVSNTIATTTSLASSKNPSTFGTSVTFTATVSPSAATGNVQFLDGSTLLGQSALSGGKATFSTSTLSLGNHSITAKYLGDATDKISTSNVVTQQVKHK
jgi:Bacterial Ig-like domain (group 3)